MAKAAIRIQKIYEGISRPVEFIKGSDKNINKLVKQIKNNSTKFEKQIRNEDNLSKHEQLHIELDEEPFGFADEKLKYPIIATVICKYNTFTKPRKMGFLSKIFTFTFVLFTLWIIAGMSLYGYASSKQMPQDPKCYVFKHNGVITSILSGDRQIFLINGEVPELERISWNPWYAEVLANPEEYCVIIDAH